MDPSLKKILAIVIFAVVALMSIIGFITMYVDKKKAQKGKWRIPEAGLFAVAILLGGIGSTLGMYVFRHKTKHWYFAVFFPIFALIDIAAVVLAGIYLL